jgi:hypothetical protein
VSYLLARTDWSAPPNHHGKHGSWDVAPLRLAGGSRHPSVLSGTSALVSDMIALLQFADDPMQQAGSDHVMAAKLCHNVLKKSIAVGRRHRFGSLHQPIEIVLGQSQSQLVQWNHGKLHIEHR